MSDKQYKLIRKQIKNVAQGMMKDAFAEEIKLAVKDLVSKDVATWMVSVNEQIKNTLNDIDKRSKDIQSYVLRNASTASEQTPEGAVDVKNVSDEGNKA